MNETVAAIPALTADPRAGEFPKRCSCGAVYDASAWRTLTPLGVFRGIDDRTGRRFGRDLELRVCVCGSSIAVRL